MLRDIVSWETGKDLGIQQTEAPRAGNILATQLASLEYATDFGIDLRYFLETEFQIQNISFQAYCVQRLLELRVNVVNVIDQVNNLFTTSTFLIGSSENSGSMMA